MKLKSLAVIALLALACSFASAQTFGFASTTGYLYCNYEQIASSGGFITGTDNLSLCGFANNATIIGGTGKVPLLGQDFSVTVDAILADNILDVEAGTVTYMQACWFQALKCTKPTRTASTTANMAGSLLPFTTDTSTATTTATCPAPSRRKAMATLSCVGRPRASCWRS